VDFIVPQGTGRLALIEAKASRTLMPAMTQSITRLAASIKGYRTQAFVVYTGIERSGAGRVLSPGVSAVTLQELLATLGSKN
jgi:hypothetical protein